MTTSLRRSTRIRALHPKQTTLLCSEQVTGLFHHLIAPFLETKDKLSLAQTCKHFHKTVHQPGNAYNALKRRAEEVADGQKMAKKPKVKTLLKIINKAESVVCACDGFRRVLHPILDQQICAYCISNGKYAIVSSQFILDRHRWLKGAMKRSEPSKIKRGKKWYYIRNIVAQLRGKKKLRVPDIEGFCADVGYQYFWYTRCYNK